MFFLQVAEPKSESFVSFLLKMLLVLLLVFSNGFFVAAEFSLVGVRKSKVLSLVEAGNNRAKILLRVISSLDAYISATQLGITLSSLALGWVGEEAIAHTLQPIFENILPSGYVVAAAHSAAILVAFTVITFLHIVLGELAPKTLALERTESVAMLIAWPMELFYKVFKAPIWVLNKSGSLVLRIVGLHSTAEHATAYTKEELRQLVEMSHKGGHLENEEMEMVNNVIEFSNTVVRQVMTPRAEVCALLDKATIEEIYNLFIENKFSRLPIYRDNLDNIAGVLNLKDVVPYFSNPKDFSLSKLLNKPFYLPETVTLEEALKQMRRARVHLAIIVDEHGGTLGVVSLEDLLEEIVGEIDDEFDQDTAETIVGKESGVYVIKGNTSIRDINKKTKIKLPEEEGYTTLAGFLMDEAGKVLQSGQKLEYEGFQFTITKTDRLRILEVLVEDNRNKTEVG
ncbi:MAG: HlyC/CorC family transporter [Acidobacteria bacterium]|nr:HlyC/CorC family transporter [Acidobacteriota bacterium]